MTTKDYKLIAQAISATRLVVGDAGDHTLDTLVDSLCSSLQDDNPRFNAAQFKGACDSGRRLREALRRMDS